MMTFLELIKTAVAAGDTELFLVAGRPVMLKSGNHYHKLDELILTPSDTEKLLRQAYDIAKRPPELLDQKRDDRFALSLTGISRIRVAAFFQRNSYALTARIIPFGIPDPAAIGIPESVMSFARRDSGLILLCGPSGSGKTTTAACMINAINNSRSCHILTLEDPIEYLFRNRIAFISQRELGLDTATLADGLEAARWISPDVLYVDNVATRSAFPAITEEAANDRLVLGLIRSGSPTAAIFSLLDLFTGEERVQIASAISRVLTAVIFQELVSDENGKHPEFRILEPDSVTRRAIATGMADIIRQMIP